VVPIAGQQRWQVLEGSTPVQHWLDITTSFIIRKCQHPRHGPRNSLFSLLQA